MLKFDAKDYARVYVCGSLNDVTRYIRHDKYFIANVEPWQLFLSSLGTFDRITKRCIKTGNNMITEVNAPGFVLAGYV